MSQLLEDLKKVRELYIQFPSLYDGLCKAALKYILSLGQNDYSRFTRIVNYFYENSPFFSYGNYLWKPYRVRPRIKFLNKLIKELEEKEKKSRIADVLEQIKYNIETGFFSGMCHAIYKMKESESLVEAEEYIREHRPFWTRFNMSEYYWRPFKSAPRIKYLDKHIKKLRK